MKDNVDLICSIGEMAGLFERAKSLEGFLQTAVSVVAHHMRAAVCSVYLYEEKSGDLVLTANQGLSSEGIGQVRLRLGEGITGRALKELRPLRFGDAAKSPFWKPVPGIEEEKYHAFLAVPILRGLTRVGVLTLQDPVPDYFDENDTKALQAIAAQLASVIENAKLLMTIGRQAAPEAKAAVPERGSRRFLLATPGASGFAMGRAMVFGSLDDEIETATCNACTREDFLRAVHSTEKQLEALQMLMEERLADVASLIFSAHILMVKDSKFTGAMLEHINRGEPPAAAIATVVKHYSELFSKSRNPMLREKVQDVKDLGRRLLRNLVGGPEESADYGGRILVAGELLPSEVLRISAQKAAGLILVGGGINSHVAILARSLQLPLVITDQQDLLLLHNEESLLIDGEQGTIYVNPADEVIQGYRGLLQAASEAEAAGGPDAVLQTRTRDGVSVEILANINMLSEVKLARRHGAAGIGLYRSEFPFIVRNEFPSEEEQFRIYRKLIDGMEGRDVTLRTLDVGGDKMLSYFPSANEANPFLGLRALRFSLRHRDIFTAQLRAMLRAGYGHPLKILFPLVTSVDDFLEARGVVQECIAALAAEAVPHNPVPALGAMIEMPSAVEVIDELAAEADFLSIGGNDLVQYMLAVDRTNEQISHMYVSHHPAVLRVLQRIADAALVRGKPLSFCGEMATNPKILPFLIGIGIRRFSVESRQIRRIHEVIVRLDAIEASQMAANVLTLGSIRAVAEALGINRSD